MVIGWTRTTRLEIPIVSITTLFHNSTVTNVIRAVTDENSDSSQDIVGDDIVNTGNIRCVRRTLWP